MTDSNNRRQWSGSGSDSWAIAALCVGAILLAGCGGFPATIPISSPTPVTPVTPAAPTTNSAVTAKNIYSIDLGNQSVDVYAANLSGTVSPTSSYAGAAAAVTGDASGSLYIGSYSSTLAAVQVYAAGASTPARSITVATAMTNAPQITTMAVDSTGNLYVAISNSIVVYGPNAAGAATPLRTLAGAQTMLGALTATQMAFDSSDNLYVATGGGYMGSQVIEFAAGATGNVAPAVVTSSSYAPTGVALDAAGSIYICQGNPYNPSQGTYTAGVYVFPKGSVAGAAPSRSITGGSTGIVLYTDGLFVDSGGNIFVGAVMNGQTDFLVFSATATGNTAPASELVRSKGATTDSQFYVR